MSTNNKKGKQLIYLALILILPSLLYVVSTTGKHNFVELPYYGPGEVHEPETDGQGIPDSNYYEIPAFEFETIDGQQLSSQQLEEKILVCGFICLQCNEYANRVAEQLSSIQSAVEEGDDVRILLFTVDPEQDYPDALTELGEGFKRKEQIWKMIRASKPEVVNFAVDGLLIGNHTKITYVDEVLQTNTLVLVDHNNHIRGYFDGLQYTETKELKDAIQQLRYLKNVIEPNRKEK